MNTNEFLRDLENESITKFNQFLANRVCELFPKTYKKNSRDLSKLIEDIYKAIGLWKNDPVSDLMYFVNDAFSKNGLTFGVTIEHELNILCNKIQYCIIMGKDFKYLESRDKQLNAIESTISFVHKVIAKK